MRREDCLRRAAQSLRDVACGVEENMPPDMLSIDLRSALDALGSLLAKQRERILWIGYLPSFASESRSRIRLCLTAWAIGGM